MPENATSTAPEGAGERTPAEVAVREYLTWLADPTQLVDADLIAQLQDEAATSTDPIVKLKALSRLEQAENVDGERYKLNFIHHAKLWADENQVSEAAFRQLGVDETILRAAGFGLASARRERKAPAARPPASSSRSVSSIEIKNQVSSWSGEFTLADVVGKVGGSPMTVRKAVEDLVEQGVVERVGPMEHHGGRGRAPILYRRR